MQPLVGDAVDGEVHLRHPPGALVVLLAIDLDVLGIAVVAADELIGLDELAARSATRVIDAAVLRLQDVDEHLDHAGGRIELTAALAFGPRELLEEILIDLAEQVSRASVALPREVEVAGVEEVNQFPESLLIDVVPVEDSR